MTQPEGSLTAPPARGAVAVYRPIKRALLYLRVSTPSQVHTDYDPEGISIPAQRAACERKAAQMGDVEIVDTFTEPGKSATSMDKRPAFQAMLERIRSDKDVDYVIVYKLSRMNRNRVDDAQVLLELRRYGVTLVSATEQIDATPVGQLMHGILAAFNEFRSAEDGADISYKMSEKARRGGTLGRAPIGYRNIRDTFEGREIRTVHIDPDRAPLVRQAFELYATDNYTIDALAEELEHRGLRTRPGRFPAKALSTTHLTTVLCNRYYLGYVIYKGEEIQGRHEAIVEPDLFERVQAVMAKRGASNVRKRTHEHYLKGVLWCDHCHQQDREFRLIRQRSKGQSGGIYDYFFCRGKQERVCTARHMWVEEIEDAVVTFYGRLRLPAAFVSLVRDKVAEVVHDEERSSRMRRQTIEQELADLDKKEEHLLDLASDGSLPSQKARDRIREIGLKRAKLTEELEDIEVGLAVGAAMICDGLELLENADELYRLASDSQRQVLNRAFFQKLYVRDNEIVSAVFNEPFDELISARDTLASTLTFPDWEPMHSQVCDNMTDRLALSLVQGSSKSVMVGAEGLEPPTCSL